MVVCYLFCQLCDVMINSACATINSARSHFADVHFSLCMSLSSLHHILHNELSSYVEEDLHKYNLPCAFAFQKQITYMHIFRGSLLLLTKTIPQPLQFHIFISPLKTSTSLSSITKKGEIVSASSAIPSWFWSIDDKPG